MSKIGIYTDAHFSISSSILSRVNGYKYSARLDFLVESFKWMYEIFRKNNVELIINCGDLTNSDLLHAEENSALSEALSFNKDIKEFYILGNHEIKDKNSSMSSVSILKGYPNITIYDKPKIVSYNNCALILVPYITDPNNYDKFYDMLNNYDKNNSKSNKWFLFSHMTYVGETYNNYIEKEGLDKILLQSRFPKIKGIFNGHLHNVKDEELYHQIGSLTGNSFGDDYSNGCPGVVILDTDTNKIERIVNPYSVMFFKLKSNSISDINKFISNINNNPYKCLSVEVPLIIKDEVSKFINDNKDKYNILEYRVKVKYEVNNSNKLVVESLNSYKTPYEALKGYVDNQSELQFPKEEIYNFLNTYMLN